MHDLVSESLQIVGEELAVTFNDVRLSLEQYADGEKGTQSLERCLGLLRTAIGVLRVTETYGAGLLTEEMESTCRYLSKLRRNDSGCDEAMEALSRAAVQLPAYVERIINGGRDIPLVLLPLLNDLRAARGKPLLSESTLLLLNISSPSKQDAYVKSRKISGEDIAKLCRVLRPQYQLALLGWIKGSQAKSNLKQIAEVAERMENAAATMELHQLWWIVGGITEALLNSGIETSVALKRLMGQVDREMKRLMTVGETRYAEQPPTDLVNNLLYYIARSTEDSERVAAIRFAFDLSDLVPADDQVEMVRESLAAPSAKLMNTVAQAIRDDLARVKDVLDIYVRTGMEHFEELGPQIELLKKIADTIGVLGLGELRETVEVKRLELEKLIERGEKIEEKALMEMAAALLKVEDHLDDQLFGLIQPPDSDAQKAGAKPDAAEGDYEIVARAVMREAVVNLARVKDIVTQIVEKPDETGVLDAVPQLLRGITAGLLIIEKQPAVSVVDELAEVINDLTQDSSQKIDSRQLDLLADAIVSLEYYMETLQAGRKEPLYMLDNARTCLKVLREGGAESIPSFKDKKLSSGATTIQAPGGESTLVSLDRASESEIDTVAVSPDSSKPERVAPELIELFIEEAGEEIESIRSRLPEWVEDENAEDALASVRRSFHTLKGSGHVVGAELLGEFCWSIEDLLNRIINKTVERTPESVDFLVQAADALPGLLEQLEVGTAPKTDVQALMTRSEELSRDEASVTRVLAPEDQVTSIADIEAETIVADESEPAEDSLPEAQQTTTEFDPVLLEVLGKETGTHLDVMNQFLEECRDDVAPFEITEEFYRASHTLHGSVTMAKVEMAVVITQPLYQLVRHAYDQGLTVGEDVIAAISDAVKAMGVIIAYLSDASRETPDFSDLRARLLALDEDIEARAELEESAPQVDVTEIMRRHAGVEEPDAESAPTGPGPEFPASVPTEASDVAAPPEFDPEIAEIFTEEAAEILESIDATLARSTDGPIGQESLASLQRDLHTLKGGARMAGLSSMGDLSHDLETFLLRISRGQLHLDTGRRKLLQDTVDELHRLSEKVASGMVGTPHGALVELLRAALESAPFEEGLPKAARHSEATLREGPPVATPPETAWSEEPIVAESGAEEPIAEEPIAEEPIAEEPGAEEPTADGLEPEQAPWEPMPVPVDKELGRLARELREPVRPEARELSELVQGAQAEAPLPERRESARIDPALLEQLLNNAGEVSIFHSRLSQQMGQIDFNLDELGQTVLRLREQLRGLELATEAQILSQHMSDSEAADSIDPLKLEKYSKIQQLSRALAETASDVSSLKDLLQNLAGETEALLVQQARTAGELQDGLMRTRMVPFQQHVARLARLVRQMAAEHGKQAELSIRGGGEIDRQVLEKMLPPFEHMLRNAVIHGIEAPADRLAAGKPEAGNVYINVGRDGSRVVIEIVDDGRGMDVTAIRQKAIDLGLTSAEEEVSDEEILQYVLRSGFSTASQLTQSSGRGVGMDVVASEVARLGGTLQIDTQLGKGTRITVRLPFTLAVTQALIVRAASELYALPLPTVEGVIRISRSEFMTKMSEEAPSIAYADQTYRLRHLGRYLGLGPARISEDEQRISLILVRAGNYSTALVADEMLDSREIIVKPVGSQLTGIRGISGATMLGDGRIAIILDVGALVRSPEPVAEPVEVAPREEVEQPLALVVDDSITMRRVSQRLLERNGLRVITARDGMQAVGMLQDHRPDIILLDVEMPRMDGYEFAKFVRTNPGTEDIPIIMITSRVSDEHKARAIELGVNDYLGKPYQESVLLDAVRHFVKRD